MARFSSFSSSLLLVSSVILLLSPALIRQSESSPTPIKYQCDMCETNWLHCIMKCSMEEYMTRHSYKNKVYMGKPKVKPKKNILDQMFEQVMHSTGHEQMRRKK